MKKSFKSIALLLVIMVFAALVAACSKNGDKDKLSIGIVLPTKDENRWVQDEQRFKDYLEDSKSKYTAEILFSQKSSDKEKQNVETLINKGIDVLIICPVDGDAASAAVELAKKEKIKVISYDRLITKTDAVDYYVTFDSVSVGAAQAQYLVDHAKGPGQPLYLYAGAASDNNAFLFFQGAWKVLQPKIADGTFKIANSSEAEAAKGTAEFQLPADREKMAKIIGQITTDWAPDTAKNLSETHLTAAPAEMKGDVAVLAPNDGTSVAISDVFAADKAIKSFVITGQDADKSSIQYIIDGKQSMTVFKDVRTLVKDAMGMAVDLLDGKDITTTGTYNNQKIDVKAKQTPVITIDKDNVKKEIVESGYYPASDFKNL